MFLYCLQTGRHGKQRVTERACKRGPGRSDIFQNIIGQNSHRKNMIKIQTLMHFMKIVFLPDQIFMLVQVY